MSNKIEYKGGTSILTLIAVAFIVLKLCHVINWSWWIVLLPIFVPVGICLLIVIVSAVIYIVGRAVIKSGK